MAKAARDAGALQGERIRLQFWLSWLSGGVLPSRKTGGDAQIMKSLCCNEVQLCFGFFRMFLTALLTPHRRAKEGGNKIAGLRVTDHSSVGKPPDGYLAAQPFADGSALYTRRCALRASF